MTLWTLAPLKLTTALSKNVERNRTDLDTSIKSEGLEACESGSETTRDKVGKISEWRLSRVRLLVHGEEAPSGQWIGISIEGVGCLEKNERGYTIWATFMTEGYSWHYRWRWVD